MLWLAFQQLHNNSLQACNEASGLLPTVITLLLTPTPRALCTAVTTVTRVLKHSNVYYTHFA